MKLVFLYLSLALLFFTISLGLYIHQDLVLNEPWLWSQLWHHETLIAIALSLNTFFLIMAIKIKR